MTARRSICKIPAVRRLLLEIIRRNYPPAQLRAIVRGWRRDLKTLVKSRRPR